MTNIMEISEHCRLCLVKDEVNIPIFEDEGDIRQVLLKITACLPVKIAKNDSLPKRICDGCLYKLESCYQFWNTSVNSEKQLLQWLSETLNGDAEANLHALKQEPADNLQNESQVFLQQQLAFQDTENYGEHFEETNYKPKKTPTKKERDREKRERERERKREEAEEEAEAPAPKRKRRAATKKPAIEIDDDDDDEEYVPSSAAITKTEDDSEDGNDDPGDDYGGDENASDDNQDEDTEPGPSGTTKSSSDAPFKRIKGGRIYTIRGRTYFASNRAPFICELCGREIKTNSRALYRHISHHYEKPIPCAICGKMQKTRYLYKSHLLYHKVTPSKCDICGAEVVHLTTHMKIHNLDKVPFKCDKCEKQFVTASGLQNHIEAIHEFSERVCGICNQVFNTKYSYYMHYRGHNAKPEDIKCKRCNKQFPSFITLRSHRKSCGKENSWVCHICGKSLKGESGLRLHYKIHAGMKDYSCEYCGKKFTAKATLVTHLHVHTKERPHICKVCNKGFSQRPSLVIHMRSHTGEKPYHCHVCPDKFVSKTALSIHFKNHH